MANNVRQSVGAIKATTTIFLIPNGGRNKSSNVKKDAMDFMLREARGISIMRAHRIRQSSYGVSAKAIQMREARLEGMLLAVALMGNEE